MKKIILTFIFLLAFLQINAQSFSVFEMDSARWKVYYRGNSFFGGFIEGYRYYKQLGDTLINGDIWKSIYYSTSSSSSYTGDSSLSIANSDRIMSVRQIGNKIYAKNSISYIPSDTLTYLLYDFGLNIGDNFGIKTNIQVFSSPMNVFINYKVTQVDTVQIAGIRKRIKLNCIYSDYLLS